MTKQSQFPARPVGDPEDLGLPVAGRQVLDQGDDFAHRDVRQLLDEFRRHPGPGAGRRLRNGRGEEVVEDRDDEQGQGGRAE